MIFCKGRIAVCVYCGHGQEVGKVEPYQVGLFYSDAYYEIDASDMPHLQFFTEKSLTTLFEKKGMALLASSVTGADISKHVRNVPEDEDELVKIKESYEKNIPRNNGTYLRCLFQIKQP